MSRFKILTAVVALQTASRPLLAQSEQTVRFSTIAIRAQNEVAQPSFVTIRTAEEWSRFLRGTLNFSGTAPTVDFRKETVVAVFAGLKPSAGYSVRVEKITESAGRATLQIRILEPAPDAMTAQVLTYPFTLVRVVKRLETVAVQPPLPARAP